VGTLSTMGTLPSMLSHINRLQSALKVPSHSATALWYYY
jgi:hypothetical protein